MKHLFVPQEIAKTLIDKGFDEPCIAYFGMNHLIGEIRLSLADKEIKPSNFKDKFLATPLYQQVVDWFMNKHNITIFWCNNKEVLNGQIKEALKLI